MTRVVDVRSKEWQETSEADRVYIGRAVPRRGMKSSKWANPFPISSELCRAGAIAKYAAWIQTQPYLLAALPELRGKTLGCWCKPEACHGDVLAALADGYDIGVSHCPRQCDDYRGCTHHYVMLHGGMACVNCGKTL